MSNTLLCPNGHVWDVSLDGESSEASSLMVCPICGEKCSSSRNDHSTIFSVSQSFLVEESPSTPAPSHLPKVPGYEVLGMLGEGGMGQVFKARHLRLGRIVALKMISREHASPAQRVRFQVEGQALAKLDHPHIVQIYEVDECNGAPYFSLEYLEGGSLDRKLAGVPQSPVAAAQLTETLARAIHWAHQQGIIHRDLKPANILLCRDGQPKISDFGLAKRLEEESYQTRTGDILGTPAYMAPEQAIGDAGAIGPLADVYALGVILYEMLTGRPPFRGVNALETMRLIRFTEPVPPKRLQPGVPRDLETICLKCMEKSPANRYSSGFELAEDLRRFLDHQTIRARRASLVERAAKWTRRNPALAALVGVICGALLSLGILGAWSNARLRFLANRADDRSRAARSVVDDLYTQFAEEWLAEEPYKDPVRQKFLEKALRLYQEFAQEERADPDLQRETALAHFRLGQIHRILNQNSEARQAYHAAIRLQQELRNKFPDSPTYRQDLANSHNWLGELCRQTESMRDAEANFGQALELQESLVAEAPQDPSYRKELARSHYNLAIVLMDTNRPDDASKILSRAFLLLGQLHEEFPAVADYRHEWARCFINRGVLHKEKQELAPAEDDYRKAIELLSPLAPAPVTGQHRATYSGPVRAIHRADLAVAYRNLGNLLWSLGRTDDARNEMSRALEILSQLAADFPIRPAYQKSLAETHNSLASALASAGKLDEASLHYGTARDLLEGLVQDHSDVVEYQQLLGITLGNLGWVHSEQGQWQPARSLYEQAIIHLQKTQASNPQNTLYARALNRQYQSLAESSIRLGDHAAAALAANAMTDVGVDQAQSCYYAACFLARCLTLAANDSSLADRELRKQRVQNYLRQALTALKQAVAIGNPQRLADENQVFLPLRDDPEFQKILAVLDRGAKP